MQSQLLRTFDDDVLSSRIPTNHMVILGSLQETGHERKVKEESG